MSEFGDNVADVSEEAVQTREIWRNSLSQLVAKYVPFNSEFRVKQGFSNNLPISNFSHNYQEFFRDRELESFLANMTVYVNIAINEERELLATIEKMISLVESEIPGN